MKLVSILDEELLLEKVPGSNRQEIYQYMLSKLAAFNELQLDVNALTGEMIVREDESGMLFAGLRMPHLREVELHDMFVAVGLPENPAAAGCDMILMTMIGESTSDIYLKMLSALARNLTNPATAGELLQAARSGKTVLWEYLSNLKLRSVVTAEDVMSPVSKVLHVDAPISEAFDYFNTTHLRFLPVVDAHGKLIGELSARQVVKSFIPDYVYMMDNVNFMNDFSVFNKIFESEHTQPISDFMCKEPGIATLDTPLFQLTLMLTKLHGGAVYIVDADNTLRGVFAIENVISKVLRG